ncbi:hypothetical protein Q75_10490 [Bacillus coahuilensis p1.1.43]|uniref:Endolytic murein transglycosylase n=1 Tax=Bacillus coahuilensis p1.1.43 TaxID=1150625 RepID=A0A147K738_9BACI|nr:endolytic transglycosylase MltG [Bacillus coahuilensis]KUP05811.1 hypothetical protein Q75_10490 [Bacillus coahuilensis p1.1.43]
MAENENQTKKEIWWKRLKERQAEAKIIRRIVLIIMVVLIIVIAGASFGGYYYVKSGLEPVSETNSEPISVEIPIGSGVTTIGNILEENGVISNGTIFKYYVKFNNQSDFQAGTYALNKTMTLDEIIESLKSGKVYEEAVFKVTVPEGLTLDVIATVIDSSTPYSQEEFMNLVTNPDFIQKMKEAYPTLITDEVDNENIRYALEGYLYPATYDFYEEKPPLEEIVETFIAQTSKIVNEFNTVMVEKEMTTHELLTLASLIEEEATDDENRKKISSVFYNRMEDGMPLQTDPTVLYGMGEHKERVFESDYQYESPFNTYLNKGLTPGPISNPGKSSIEAALFPDDTNFYYFLAAKVNGEITVLFSESYEEHESKRSEYILNN